MGIIRKENKWRLEKKEDGVYLITHNKKPKRKIITDDYGSRDIVGEKYDQPTPVNEVKSFSDVTYIFESKIKNETTESSGDIENISPLLFIITFGFIGIYVISQNGLDYQSMPSIFGISLILLAFVFVFLTYNIYRREGKSEAMNYLLSSMEDNNE